jgi:hypothetical protein
MRKISARARVLTGFAAANIAFKSVLSNLYATSMIWVDLTIA